VYKQQLDPKTIVKLDKARLAAAVDKTIDRDWKEAQKYIEKGNVERGKKTLIRTFPTHHLSRPYLQSF
jgi:hypothetical protein